MTGFMVNRLLNGILRGAGGQLRQLTAFRHHQYHPSYARPADELGVATRGKTWKRPEPGCPIAGGRL
jgi:hypothetical protein